MLHRGYVDEVLFGEEVVRRLPEIAKSWADEYKMRPNRSNSDISLRNEP
jgi:hypothetical protein